MAEEEAEFQESEIVFPESLNFLDDHDLKFSGDAPRESRNKKHRTATKKREASSLPVNIPESWFRCVDVEPDLFDDGEIVPPHVLTGRRIAGKMMAFSVCTGYGRTLKGRDLSEVRNSILRMTGFLEA